MLLIDALQQVCQESMKAAGLTDLQIGTVTAAAPLEVTVDTLMQPLRCSTSPSRWWRRRSRC